MRPLLRILLPLSMTLLTACGAPGPADSGAQSGPEPATSPNPGPSAGPASTPTGDGPIVDDFVSGTCSTSVVLPLSIQLITELDCLQPGAVSEIPPTSQIEVDDTFDYLQTAAGATLPVVASQRSSVPLHLTSALRSLAQQYLLYRWYLDGRCGIALAATPGTSRHESGLAVDVQDYDGWRADLQSEAWQWYGSSDPVHYDFSGGGTTDIRGASVLAFQRIWNLNNPGDTIDEDGAYGPQTAARLQQSPANGFQRGSTCGAQPFTGSARAFSGGVLAPDNCAM